MNAQTRIDGDTLMRRCGELTVLTVMLLLPCRTQAAEYTFTTIDFPGAAETIALGINNHGTIVGEYGDIESPATSAEGNRGFIYDGTTFETIHVPGAILTRPMGINDSNEIVGQYATFDGYLRGFLYDGTDFQDVVPPFGDHSMARGINNEGEIVGSYWADATPFEQHGFYFDGQKFHEYDLPDASSTLPASINDSGQQVGLNTLDVFGIPIQVGFLLPDDIEIAHPESALTVPTGINNNGEVVGTITVVDVLSDRIVAQNQGFLFDSKDESYVTIPLPGPDCSYELATVDPTLPARCLRSATGVNSARTIVGYFDNDDGAFHGFVGSSSSATVLQAGDADMDLDFDQLDLVQVQIAAKYLTGEAATWGEGDWDGAPGGEPGNPPEGDGVFNQLDIIAALEAGRYLTGSYAVQLPVPTAVPEPATLLALLLGAMIVCSNSCCGFRFRRQLTRR